MMIASASSSTNKVAVLHMPEIKGSFHKIKAAKPNVPASIANALRPIKRVLKTSCSSVQFNLGFMKSK